MSIVEIFDSHRSGVAQVILERERERLTAGTAFLVHGGLSASQEAMAEIAVNLRRSANVGIGYAFAADHIRKQVQSISPS